MSKIAIVNSSSFGKHFPKHIETLKSIGAVDFFKYEPNEKSEVLINDLKDYDYIISSVTPNFRRDFFENTPKLKLISRHGIGYNNIDVQAATDHNVYVTKVDAIVEQDAVAENAIALIMALSRSIVNAAQAAIEGEWGRRAEFMGFQFRNKTAGVIGVGNIGSRVAEIFRDGFKMKVYAYDPYLSEAQKNALPGIVFTDLETVVSNADFLSLNAFLDNESYHILDEALLKTMKPTSLIVNTARGALVDDRAIIKAIQTGTVAGYAADVVENEPIDANHYLLQDHRILITPHTSAYTWECLEGMGDKCVDDVLKVHRNENPTGLINKEMVK